jgi:lipopolysaccharide transport system permease protein
MMQRVRSFGLAHAHHGDRSGPSLRIEPSKGWASLRLDELWHYRELLYFFVWRDVRVRYKQTMLGGSWAVIQPLFTMVIFSLFFGKLARIPSDGLPYPIFSYTALVPWTLFANGLGQSANSLVGCANLIKKVYFPRMAVPIGTVLAGIVDFFLAFIVLLGMMIYYGAMPTLRLFWVPFFVLLALITSLGTGLWLSALNVQFRDVRHILPFITQIWMFATPIAYSSSLVVPSWRTVYAMNPMVSVIDGFRWTLLGTAMPSISMMAISVLVSSVILISGAFYFRRMERTFADIV